MGQFPSLRVTQVILFHLSYLSGKLSMVDSLVNQRPFLAHGLAGQDSFYCLLEQCYIHKSAHRNNSGVKILIAQCTSSRSLIHYFFNLKNVYHGSILKECGDEYYLLSHKFQEENMYEYMTFIISHSPNNFCRYLSSSGEMLSTSQVLEVL